MPGNTKNRRKSRPKGPGGNPGQAGRCGCQLYTGSSLKERFKLACSFLATEDEIMQQAVRIKTLNQSGLHPFLDDDHIIHYPCRRHSGHCLNCTKSMKEGWALKSDGTTKAEETSGGGGNFLQMTGQWMQQMMGRG